MSIEEIGKEGERLLYEYLKAQGCELQFQADRIAKTKSGWWHLYEVKHQEMYLAPPFDGHGLPSWQVEARLKFQKETRVFAVLVVYDKNTKEVYWNYLEELEKSNYFDTKGKKPRRIYPLTAFKRLSTHTP